MFRGLKKFLRWFLKRRYDVRIHGDRKFPQGVHDWGLCQDPRLIFFNLTIY